MREAGMRREHREALRSLHLVLARQLVAGELQQHLLSQRILTEEMMHLIEAKVGSFNRNVELLLLLPKRGPSAFDVFLQALRDTEQTHLAQLLLEQLREQSGPEEPGQIEKAHRPDHDPCPRKKQRVPGPAEWSLDNGDGPIDFPVAHCSLEFYQHHRDTSYRMESCPKGLALIISNVRFGGANELVDRHGGEVDHCSLDGVLHHLGFSVCSHRDLTAEAMRAELQRFSQLPDHRRLHSCLVALLSHGVEGAVYGTDGRLVQLDDVWRLFDNENCPQLQNKPKIFLIQACRGEETDCGVDLQDGKERVAPLGCEQSDTGIVEPIRMKLPTRSDIICGYACLPGTTALRNTRRGSWYVQALTRVLAAHAKDTHLADILVKVNALIKEREGFCPGSQYHRCKEMSEHCSSLCRDLHLFPGIFQKQEKG
ncbi:caspase-2 isoform X1 [Narcine bancroftii]|uniref:caspase-2 isoform X1 n=1 Tax=Narcine bancroftii TaxID=1343680 RepID=UPI00383209B2